MITDSPRPPDRPRARGDNPGPSSHEERRYSTETLFGASREIIIELQGAEYRLRITSNGKLVLNK